MISTPAPVPKSCRVAGFGLPLWFWASTVTMLCERVLLVQAFLGSSQI